MIRQYNRKQTSATTFLSFISVQSLKMINYIYIYTCKCLKSVKNCMASYIYTVFATAKLTSFSFFAEERRRIFQRTKTHISENEDAYFRERRRKKRKRKKKRKRQKKTQTQKKTKTQKNASLLGHYTKACRL